MSALEQYTRAMLPEVEAEMRQVLALVSAPETGELYQMLLYHMGWSEPGTTNGSGKRIRPLLVLLACEAAAADWRSALPAAAAVELLHNFSLIHDDIQDQSELRRGRPALWTRVGIAQAINAGDALFTLAHLAMLRLQNTCTPERCVAAVQVAQQTCLALTQGQYLDMSYEKVRSLPVEAYWPMISGKTAALTAACTELGALVAGVSPARQGYFADFGRYLGLAFQVYDDILGIWGDPVQTGKSAASDLLSGKKSLPVLFGLQRGGGFARRWLAGALQVDEVAEMARLLETEGGRQYAQQIAGELTEKSLQALSQAQPAAGANAALLEMADLLLQRNV